METPYDSYGFLNRVGCKYTYGRNVSLTKWNGQIWIHLSDETKAWENGKFDKSKSKTISLNWEYAKQLRESLFSLEDYAN